MALFDQLICMKYSVWRILSIKKTTLASLGIILFFFLLNIHLNFTVKYSPVKNLTFIELTLSSQVLLTWLNVNKLYIL